MEDHKDKDVEIEEEQDDGIKDSKEKEQLVSKLNDKQPSYGTIDTKLGLKRF
jgi:hypothetical protein